MNWSLFNRADVSVPECTDNIGANNTPEIVSKAFYRRDGALRYDNIDALARVVRWLLPHSEVAAMMHRGIKIASD
jgi:hypothetical protein